VDGEVSREDTDDLNRRHRYAELNLGGSGLS
jgi:hypothetical protein